VLFEVTEVTPERDPVVMGVGESNNLRSEKNPADPVRDPESKTFLSLEEENPPVEAVREEDVVLSDKEVVEDKDGGREGGL